MEIKKSNLDGVIFDVIDEFTINKFIAVGGESIVFKGEKKSVGRTYALKFRKMDRWADFFNFEMKTLSRLEQCSTSKLAGVIPDISLHVLQDLFRMIPESKQQQCIELTSPTAQYFCIVEDYISGCDLNEYCRGDASRGIIGNAPTADSSYEEVVAFQRKLLQWTMQFCEIMSHVTEEHRFLHLDIKPENIMVSSQTESITIIDFGKSMEIKNADDTVSLNMEFGDDVGVFGTNGFAAPECCDSPDARRSLRLKTTGIVDQRSDIFSFGASLWDCINPDRDLRIKMTEDGYFRRDLFNVPDGYIKELEGIIVKCTEKNPQDRYQNYDELKEAAQNAEKMLLERDKPKKSFLALVIAAGFLFVLILLSAGINGARASKIYEISKYEFDEIANGYTENDLNDYKDKAIALIEADPERTESYNEVLEVSYSDGAGISKSEVEDVLLKCLSHTADQAIIKEYIDTIMGNIFDFNNVKSVAESLALKRNLSSTDCDGMTIAKAIVDYNKDPVGSYQVVSEYNKNEKYKVAVDYLKQKLNNNSELKQKIVKSTSAHDISEVERVLEGKE